MSSPFAAQLALVRTTLAALTPFDDGVAFQPAAGDLDLTQEPGVLVRLFQVNGQPEPGLTQGLMQPGNRQAQRRFDLTILYDSNNNRDELEVMIASDEEQIIGALESGAAYASNVQLVQCVGGSTTQDDQFFRRTLSFAVTYVHSF